MHWILVDVATQTLMLYFNDDLVQQFPASTSSKGVGEKANSFQTPRGWHVISEKIGDDAEKNTVFVGRKPTGAIFHSQNADMSRDWILTRILRLSGMEEGKNKGGELDTYSRTIYIHGVPDERLAKAPASKGCVGLSSDDVMILYREVTIGTPICIMESKTVEHVKLSNIAALVFNQYNIETMLGEKSIAN